MSTALLLSGGMDSIALAWWMRPRVAITVDYGQLPAKAEINAAAQVSAQLAMRHCVVLVDARAIGSGDMAGTVPSEHAPASDWWPYRNQLLVTLAGAAALREGCTRLLLGTVATDAQHRDGSPEFIDCISMLMQLQEGGLRVEAPAIGLTTQELLERAQVPADLLAWSHSCHKANTPCCQCRGCNKQMDVLYSLYGEFYGPR